MTCCDVENENEDENENEERGKGKGKGKDWDWFGGDLGGGRAAGGFVSIQIPPDRSSGSLNFIGFQEARAVPGAGGITDGRLTD